MKTIVIPTDFSDIANNAMQYGLEMAKATNASVTLLHVFQVPVSLTDVPVALVSVEELQSDADKRLADTKMEAEKNLRHFDKKFTPRPSWAMS